MALDNLYIDVDKQHGCVELIDAMQMAPVQKTVRSARVSYARDTLESTPARDSKLLRSLARENHWSPYRHRPIPLHVRCPEFIARPWYKHVVGSSYSFIDTGWNELSQRYSLVDKFYLPEALHYQSGTNHQGAAGYHANSDTLREQLATVNKRAAEMYNMLITAGVAKEEARMCLPLSVYTRFYWTASQQALWHFVQLRRAPGAQGAIRLYAEAVNEICSIHYGDAWQAIQEQQQ